MTSRAVPAALALALAFTMALASAPALAGGDPAAGKKVFKKCKACHTLKAGKNRIGPSLAGILGRPAASVKGFKYSKAMKGSGLVWDTETLGQYLESPKKLVPKTKMIFKGLKKEKDRVNLIAYLIESAK